MPDEGKGSDSSDDFSPDTLYEQSTRFVVKNLNILGSYDYNDCLILRPGVTLPSIVCENLLDAYQDLGFEVDEKFCTLFRNPDYTPLRRVRLKSGSVNDAAFKMIVNTNATEVEIIGCRQLSENSLQHLNEKSKHLVSLTIEAPTSLFPESKNSTLNTRGLQYYEELGYILNAPNLRKLTLRKIYLMDPQKYFPLFFSRLKKLTHLDLSGCCDVLDISYLSRLDHLTSLILFNVRELRKPKVLSDLKKLKTLRHLDISQSIECQGIFQNPNHTLVSLVESLPNLVSLDISGTNLGGAVETVQHGKKFVETEIPGLRSRRNKPLEFLGLYRTHNEACRCSNLYAKKVTGDANEEQILNALQAYMDRCEVLVNILNDLYHIFRYERFENIDGLLSLLLKAMGKHLDAKQIQISGSAILFYVAKIVAHKPNFNLKTKRELIKTLINSLGAFQSDETVMRNVCLSLIQFNVPYDMLFEYERLVLLMLYVVSEVDNENFIQRIGVHLLNSLACHVDDPQKQLLGHLGTIDRMLNLIEDRLQRQICDDVLEVAWSTMWNITDETVENCQRFLSENGMELFLSCLNAFPNREELLRNMMGLLGNVAEMKPLRPFLMTERFVPVFAELLDSTSDGIEVSYNAAGVLVHMCSDGVEAWTVREPQRDIVLKKIVWAINRWNLAADRNINYRSFQPILGLLKVTHTEECRYWAVWALANLTTVYRDKYCPLVINENGLELLEEVVQTQHTHSAINRLARLVINNCSRLS